jgi:hypothetical protein
MSWFDVAEGRLRFRGRLTKDPIREWVSSEEGAVAVQAAAREIGFSLVGRTRSARNRMRRRLWEAIAAPSLRDTVAAECDRYVAAWSQLAYAPSLPRLSLAARRVVVVPRVMIAWRTVSGATARLAACLQRADVPDLFKAFFAGWVFSRMEDAICRAQPRPERPLSARESWACVAVDTDLIWIDPSWSGPEWRGHVVMFEMPAPRLQRRDRRELEVAIAQLTQSLPNLTRGQRDHTVRMAMDQLASVRA